MSELHKLPHKQRISVQPRGIIYEIQIDEPLESPADWRDELSVIRNATESDIIHMFFNGPGGDKDTMLAFLAAMRTSGAHIVGHLTGSCCSALTFMFLACHEYIIHDDIEFMIHTVSTGYQGKENNFQEYATHLNQSTRALVKDMYKGFLTDEEIERTLEGKDWWFNAKEVKERLDKRNKSLAEEQEAEETLIADVIDEPFAALFPEEDEHGVVKAISVELTDGSSPLLVNNETTWKDIKSWVSKGTLVSLLDYLKVEKEDNEKFKSLAKKFISEIETVRGIMNNESNS